MNITEAKELSTRELIRHITNTHHKAEEKLIEKVQQQIKQDEEREKREKARKNRKYKRI